MPKDRGLIARIRRRPEYQRRIAGTALYLIIAAGAMLFWARSFSGLMMPSSEPSGEAESSARPSLLSPFASIRDEFARAGGGFADLMRAIPGILGKTEDLAARPAPAGNEPGSATNGTNAAAATPQTALPEKEIVIVPPEATGAPTPTRIARVEQNGIAAEIVLDAADSLASPRIPALAPSAKTAAVLAASSRSSFLDPIRNILLSFTRDR